MAEQSPSSPPQDSSSGNESLDNLVYQAPQPMREEYVQNAVKFLSHPKVKGSSVVHRRSFLEKKGLTKEEIDEAFRQVPDPQPNSTDAAAVASQQANNPNPSFAMQPYKAAQSQAATGSFTAGPIVSHTKAEFSWVQALLGAGLFLGMGASAAIAVKKLFVPRLKSWTRRVVAEGDANANDELKSRIYEDIREAVKVSASAFSDIARTNHEVLASKDEDRKILMKLTEALDAQGNVLKSLSETLNHIRENRFSQYNMLEEHVQPAPWNGPTDNQWRASHQANVYTASANSGFDSGRHSFVPSSSAEPTYGSFPGSYTERVQRPGYGFQPQTSSDRSNLVAQGGYQGGSSYPQSSNAIGSPSAAPPESPFQRRWVPPQPPAVIMPEAAAAIRQPRFLPRQPSQPTDGRLSTDVPRPPEPAVAREQVNGGTPGGELSSGASTTTANPGSSGNEEQQQQEDAQQEDA